MKVKDFALRTQPYNDIASGKKTTEYRDLSNLYYTNTLLNVDAYSGKTAEQVRDGLLNGTITKIIPSGITHLRFHNTGRMMVVEVKGLRLDKKNKLWCIDLGKVLSGRSLSKVAE